MLHACCSSRDLPGVSMRHLINVQSLQLPIMGLCRVEEEAGFVILTKRCQIRWGIFQQQRLLLLQDLQSHRMHVSILASLSRNKVMTTQMTAGMMLHCSKYGKCPFTVVHLLQHKGLSLLLGQLASNCTWPRTIWPLHQPLPYGF